MKKYKITILIMLVIAIFSTGLYFIISYKNKAHGVRTNTECTTTDRIFDYHNVLSDSEKSSLNELISECENKVGMDIVILTIDNDTDESLLGTANNSNYYVGEYADIQRVAESFCDYYKFGWEDWNSYSSSGTVASSSIVIAANWDTGDAWICTSGKAKYRIGDTEAEAIVQEGCHYLRKNPEKGFSIMIKQATKLMGGNNSDNDLLKPWQSLVAAVVFSIIFFAVNMSKKAGKNTTTATTYVSGGNAQMLDRYDRFVTKKVTSVRIESSSGGGHSGGSGGGGGGGSHGGGGGHF
jgi:uncharacterized membrane protein YgcG